MRVQSLGPEDSLEEGMATHSSILAWRTLMDRGAWRATVHWVTKNQTRLSMHACEKGSIAFISCEPGKDYTRIPKSYNDENSNSKTLQACFLGQRQH